MIIAHNPAIVKHFPKYIVAPGRKTRKNPGAQQKEKNTKNRFTLQYYNSTTRINCQPLFSKIFRMVEFHSISHPAIRKQASKVLQIPGIYQLPHCISQQLPLSSPETLSSIAVLQLWSLAPQRSCTRSCLPARPAELCCDRIGLAGHCAVTLRTAEHAHDDIDAH